MFHRSTCLVFLAAFALMLASTSGVNAQDTRIVEKMTSAEMKSLLQSEGFTSVEIDSDDDLIVKMQGYHVLIFVRTNNYTNIQYRFAVGGTNVTLQDLNEWNKGKLFTKAYLDDDGDPVLEMDVDLAGGVTIARIKDSIRTFDQSLAAFLSEITR